jgi:hypothetical protein
MASKSRRLHAESAMKLPRQILLSIIPAVLLTVTSVSNASDHDSLGGNLEGSWTHDSPERDSGLPLASLSLRLRVEGTRISGEYCYIYNYGRKIDCPDDHANNLHGKLSTDLSRANVRVHSVFSDVDFNASIRLVGKTLEFISESSDEMTFPHPSTAILHRSGK